LIPNHPNGMEIIQPGVAEEPRGDSILQPGVDTQRQRRAG